MHFHRWFLVVLFAVVVSACSSGVDDTVDAVDEAETAAAPTEEDAADTDTDADTDASTIPSGPTTTFVPNLEGPFNLDGGATSGANEADVIVDPSITVPPSAVLSQLTWPTDWTRRTVEDWDEFLAGLGGSDPRDGIPPLDNPVFETVALAGQWLGPREPGALVQLDGEARFYPLSILTRHEIVNDAFGDVPVAVTFCPLCNTALSFDRRVDGEVLRLGVSGLLRNSDMVMWDSATTSLWQQITGEGVVGQFAGTQLDIIPTSIVSFEQFAENFPDGASLAAESGFGRTSYGLNPYQGYSSSSRPFLFNGEIDERLPALSRVVGLDLDGVTRAYPFETIMTAGAINDTVGETPVAVLWAGDTADALDDSVIGISDAIGTALVLDPVVDGQLLTFSSVADEDTFTDAETGSTWTILGQAVAGPLEGTQLETVVHRNEFWFAWQAFFGADNLFGS
jgi:hypothetical protein